VWIGHGLKDMAVKEIRRSVAMLDETTSASPDHGLIRDVLLNPEAYRDFLLDAYQQAWEDGVITEEEMKELRSFQSALGLSDEEMDEISEQAKSTAQDAD
jgi:tellurite resistance protein